jgi:hypothetical protein
MIVIQEKNIKPTNNDTSISVSIGDSSVRNSNPIHSNIGNIMNKDKTRHEIRKVLLYIMF